MTTFEPPPIHDPYSRDELRRDLEAVQAWSLAFWRGLDPAAFFAPLGDAWSAADNVRHLVKSNRPVAKALLVPRFVLFLRFGMARRPSRRYAEVVAVYHGALAGGLKAGGYAPSAMLPTQQTPEQRERALAALAQTFADLRQALDGWTERSLDRRRLPHPSSAVGLLTVREMLLFTLYHNTHHVANVVRLTAGSAGA